ncbi:MAG: matrixin family metalloprotease [Thermoanaerobaculia bacterium]|nr:matrixin family metalloprotease [Thermoanaerobaculia bacterium]
MNPLRIRTTLLSLIAVLVLSGSATFGMTIALIQDEALVDHAPVIVVGAVEARLPHVNEAATTRWLFRIEREIKGTGLPSAIVVELPGGRAADGADLQIPGVPTFKKGARLLLFLRNEGPEVFRIFQLPQGAFYKVRNGNRWAALQSLSEVNVLAMKRGKAANPTTVRDFDRFVHWIENRADGVPSVSDYRLRPTRRGLRAMTKAFNLMSSNGRNVRWTAFDSGGAVPWRNNGQMTDLAGGGVAELARALRLWENEKSTPVRLPYVGVSVAAGGFGSPDGQNVVLFGDPNNEIDDIICGPGGGGTLARGGWWHFGQSTSFNQKLYWALAEGDIVVNNGLGCVLQTAVDPSRWTERILAHELGHTLGINHSSENPSEPNAKLREALMFWAISNADSRGVALKSDDVAALQALYRKGKASPPPPPGSCPPGTLCLVNNRFEVTATWENQYDGSSGTAGAVRASDVSGYLYFTDPRNYEVIVKVLDFGNVVKVFYGQLTDLRFVITVRDKRTGASKEYRNTPGNCGGLDESGFPAASVAARFAAVQSHPYPAPIAGTCRADSDTMCLMNNRFAIEVNWRNQYDNSTGRGIPKRLTDLTGAFGFTSTSNLELLVKTLDFGDRLLVIYGALSNLEYTLRVTDTVTGRSKSYENPAYRYCGGLDPNF